ncbi:MAG TPA: NFACT RNA binding domain-containing protein [Candidatus Eisenbacteria bacterium]|nr:NFACT RNA binding domain-containing protein [Candidatus Eisenbacteria bacterium]
MSQSPATLEGLPVSGVIGHAPRSLVIAVGAKPRRYLWIHLERKEAAVALAADLPTSPDPRGSRFGGLEDPLRGLVIREVRVRPGSEMTLSLGRDENPRTETHRLILAAEKTRVNLTLTAVADGNVLWAHHREPEKTRAAGEDSETEDAAVGSALPVPVPAAFRPPRVRFAETDADRSALRAAIVREFEEDFGREIDRELKAAERVLTRRLEAQGRDLERTRVQQDARRWGEILLTHYRDIPRGASRVRLPDTFADSPGAEIEIPLDPALSTHENAARLFAKAKKGERGQKLVQSRLTQTRQHLADLGALRQDLMSRPPREALGSLERFLTAAGLTQVARGDSRKIRLGRQTPGAPRALRPGRRPPGARKSTGPRTFHTSDGWEVWVGRNNTDNDHITHRLSNPHDLWFHVVGVPGSHVILRRPSRSAIPKPRTLEEAAAVAAYFSKARKQTRVPVIYTERKFVSKPRRGKPGQALCTRERELLVRPRLPEGRAGNDDENEREVSS